MCSASTTAPVAGAVRVGLEVLHLGDEEDVLEQVVQALAGAGRDGHGRHVTAELLDEHVVLGELLQHAVGVGALEVDLVDRDDDRHAGGAGVVDRLDRLRHDAVVRRDDEHGDVGDLGAAGAHGREGLVAGRVEEGDLLAVDLDLVGADVLRDAAGLLLGDAGLADGVEQARLAVVDVAEDGDDRRARRAAQRRLPALRTSPRGARSTVTSPTSADSASRGSKPKSVATIAAVSKSMTWLMLAMTPFFINSLMISTADTLSVSASSLTDSARGSCTSLLSTTNAAFSRPYVLLNSHRTQAGDELSSVEACRPG